MENETRTIKQEKIKAFVKKHKLVIIGGGCVALGFIFGYKFGFANGQTSMIEEFSSGLHASIKNGVVRWHTESRPKVIYEIMPE